MIPFWRSPKDVSEHILGDYLLLNDSTKRLINLWNSLEPYLSISLIISLLFVLTRIKIDILSLFNWLFNKLWRILCGICHKQKFHSHQNHLFILASLRLRLSFFRFYLINLWLVISIFQHVCFYAFLKSSLRFSENFLRFLNMISLLGRKRRPL